MEVVPIDFEVASDLAYWRAEVPSKVSARAEALTGPMTPPGQRVQLLNAPGSEVGPGQVATWGKATTHRVDALGVKWEAEVSPASTFHSIGRDQNPRSTRKWFWRSPARLAVNSALSRGSGSTDDLKFRAAARRSVDRDLSFAWRAAGAATCSGGV
jgi:hypothetical protein